MWQIPSSTRNDSDGMLGLGDVLNMNLQEGVRYLLCHLIFPRRHALLQSFKALQVLTYLLPLTASGWGTGWSRCTVKWAMSYFMDFAPVCSCVNGFLVASLLNSLPCLVHFSEHLDFMSWSTPRAGFLMWYFKPSCVAAWKKHLIFAWEPRFIHEGPINLTSYALDTQVELPSGVRLSEEVTR